VDALPPVADQAGTVTVAEAVPAVAWPRPRLLGHRPLRPLR
jgi:hypothetical protein